jgi:predicted nucleotidyltransferase
MDHSAIPLILREINLNDRDVANIYHHGSWAYGTNSPTSDRDLIIVTRSPSQTPVIFRDDFNYFHEFELHRLWNEYDVCIYSVANFETLLERNFLPVVQCVFLPDEFKLKEDIDFRTIYLEKYYNKLTLKQVVFYEIARYLDLFDTRNYSAHGDVSTLNLQTIQSRQDYLFKNLFHGLRYLDFVEQLIETCSIHNFKRASYLFDRMKKIRGDPTDGSNLER